MPQLYSILIIFLLCSSGLATWSKQKNDVLKVQLGIVAPRYNFEVHAPPDISSSLAKFEPNTPSKTALNLSYRNLGATISVANSPTEESRANLGTSSSTDLQLRFFGKRTYEFFYQSYKGYYVVNSVDLDPSYASLSSRIQRPDIKTSNYGLNFYWNLDDKDYSQAVAFEQAGRQKDSSWGLSWFFHGSRSQIVGESPFIPGTAASSFGTLASVDSVARTTGAVGIGIGGILTAMNFYMTGFVAVGPGLQYLSVKGDNIPEANSSVTGSYASARIGVGYNGEKNVVGLQLLSDGVTSKIAGGEINGSTLALSLFYAYRFDGVDLPVLNVMSGWVD
jgi:hypothetical protein